jgi:hypothetical protein
MNTLYQLNLVPIHLMQIVILTQKHILCNEKYLSIEMFEMNDLMIKKKHKVSNKLSNHLLDIKKSITYLLKFCICVYIMCNAFFYYGM